jgi:hypothetical protein
LATAASFWAEIPITPPISSRRWSGEAPISSAIAEDGTYHLEAEPGVYRVGISAPRQFPEGTKPEDTFRMNLPPPHVPPAYNAAERSGLEATVEAKDNLIDFALQPIGGEGR